MDGSRGIPVCAWLRKIEIHCMQTACHIRKSRISSKSFVRGHLLKEFAVADNGDDDLHRKCITSTSEKVLPSGLPVEYISHATRLLVTTRLASIAFQKSKICSYNPSWCSTSLQILKIGIALNYIKKDRADEQKTITVDMVLVMKAVIPVITNTA